MILRSILIAAIAFVLTVVQAPDGHGAAIFERIIKGGVVRIGLPYNMIPQGFLKPDGDWTGFEVDLASEMARHMNLKLEKVKINENTWGRLLSDGRIDAAMCRIRHTRSLESTFDFSVAYFFDAPRILTVKGKFKSAGELKGHRIAAVQGSAMEKAAMRFLAEAGDPAAEKNVVSYPDRAACFLALGKDKVSGWIDSGMTLLEYAARNPGRFDFIDASDAVEAVAVAVPQDDSAWRDLVNFTVQDMAADGSLKRIYDKWFGQDTQHPFRFRRSIEIWPE